MHTRRLTYQAQFTCEHVQCYISVCFNKNTDHIVLLGKGNALWVKKKSGSFEESYDKEKSKLVIERMR